jgi:hypothetical protein
MRIEGQVMSSTENALGQKMVSPDEIGVAGHSTLADNRRIRLIFSLCSALIVAVQLCIHRSALLMDPDNWWHVRVGLDMLTTHVFPRVDTYSFTFAGAPWIAKEWLGQILLALGYSTAGWGGVVLVAILPIVLTIFLMTWYLSESLKPTLAVVVTLAAAFLLTNLYNARPFIFTFPIIVIWTEHLYRAARSQTAPSLWLLPLICLWANLHATFTFGFIIAAFAGLAWLSQAKLSQPKQLGQWILFGLLCVAVSLINPYGFQAILATFTVSSGNEAVPFIQEWRAFNAGADYFQEAALLLIVAVLLLSRLRIGWAHALLFLFTLHLFLAYMRFQYLFVLLMPLVLAAEVAAQFPALSARVWAAESRDRLERFLMARFSAVGTVIAAAGVATTAALVMLPSTPSEEVSAEDALAFAREHHLSGNVMNAYNFGGTLIFHGIKTYIDGRTDQLFLNGFMNKTVEMGTSAGKPLLEAEIKAQAIRWALLTAEDKRIPFFREMAGWRQAYSDKNAVIFVNEN